MRYFVVLKEFCDERDGGIDTFKEENNNMNLTVLNAKRDFE
jgi:hypothetical protein